MINDTELIGAASEDPGGIAGWATDLMEALGAPGAGLAGMIALGAGAWFGATETVGRWFVSISGVLAGIIAMTVLMAMTIASNSDDLFGLPLVTILVVGLFVAGLDWQQVTRLRTIPLLASPFMVIAASSGESGRNMTLARW